MWDIVVSDIWKSAGIVHLLLNICNNTLDYLLCVADTEIQLTEQQEISIRESTKKSAAGCVFVTSFHLKPKCPKIMFMGFFVICF